MTPTLIPAGLHDLFRRLALKKGVRWQEYQDAAQLELATLEDADIVTSQLPDGRHIIAIDLDVPAYQVASTTESHSHLYIDVPGGIDWEDYVALLELLAKLGVLESGYVAASKGRGFTSLRLPWVKKEKR